MAIICPAVLQEHPEEFKKDLEKVTKFAERIQIDIADGVFAPNRTINLVQAYWPENIKADIHLMLQDPTKEMENLISMKPHLAIVHAEASGDLKALLAQLQEVDIKTGVAFRAETQVESAHALVAMADHVLIFGGTLGSYGGSLDSSCLPKAQEAKSIKSDLELGWDGGVNDENVAEVVKAGFDVVNVGGFIQKADNPRKAYDKLVQIAQEVE